MLTLFTIGAAGNINHIDVKSAAPQKGHEEAQRIGTILAGEVVKSYAKLEPVRSDKLQIAHVDVPLILAPLAAGDEERANAIAKKVDAGQTAPFLDTVFAFRALDTAVREGKPLGAEVQVITLGDQIAWVGLPGEIFTELGTAIKQASPFPLTIIAELAHGPVTYIPNAAAFPQGNYEVVSSRAAEGSGEKLAAEAKTLLKEAYPPRRQAISPRETTLLFNGRDLDGWYTWSRDNKLKDPHHHVFSVVDGMIRISERGVGRDHDATVVSRLPSDRGVEVGWSDTRHPRREGVRQRNPGACGGRRRRGFRRVDGIGGVAGDRGRDGRFHSGGRTTAAVQDRDGAGGSEDGELYWDENGKPVTRERVRFDWYGRDPDWKDVAGFRGKVNVENPVGEWNRSEVICDGDTIKNILNGKVMNYGTNSSHTFGKIQLQSEGAEIWIRRVELEPVH